MKVIPKYTDLAGLDWRLGTAIGGIRLQVDDQHEQDIVRGGDMRRIDKAFFQINSWIGMVLLAVVAVDIYLV